MSAAPAAQETHRGDMGMLRFVGLVLPLVFVATNAFADEPKSESSIAPEGIVLASVGGVGMGVGLGMMAVAALSNLSLGPKSSGCDEMHGAEERETCAKRYAAEDAREDAVASTKIRNGAIVAGIGTVLLALGVMIVVSSQKSEVRKPKAGLQVLPPPIGSGAPSLRGVALEMPLVGGTF